MGRDRASAAVAIAPPPAADDTPYLAVFALQRLGDAARVGGNKRVPGDYSALGAVRALSWDEGSLDLLVVRARGAVLVRRFLRRQLRTAAGSAAAGLWW